MEREISREDASFLAEVEAESIGWQLLGEGVYLHVGKPDETEPVITLVGLPEAGMTGMNVLLLT